MNPKGLFTTLGAEIARVLPGQTRSSRLGPDRDPWPGKSHWAWRYPESPPVFVCRPLEETDEAACARQILSTLARRAFRRPVTEADLRDLLALYNSERSTATFEAGIEMALRSMLTSPYFLFRVERDPASVAPSSPYRLTDLELASRLSFFLWSSIPDDQLLDLAVRRRLTDSVVLEQQVKRMLADPRSRALITNFAGQWLSLRQLRFATPDEDAFPEFDENLREAFLRETSCCSKASCVKTGV